MLQRAVAVRDSLVGIAHILSLMAEEDRPLSALADSLPKFFMVKRKVPFDRGRLQAAYDALRARFSEARFDAADGLRIDLPEGWLHVRPSNTEPVVRIIAESEHDRTARRLADEASRILESLAANTGTAR